MVTLRKWGSVYLNLVLMAAATLLVAGCGKDSPTYSLLPTGNTFIQTNSAFNNNLDILFVVDDSGSMAPSQVSLNTNFDSFITTFVSKGYNFRIAVTSTDAYLSDPTLANYSSSNANLANFKYVTRAGPVPAPSGSGSYTGNQGCLQGNTPCLLNTPVIVPTMSNIINTFVANATTGTVGSGDERAFSSIRSALNANANAGFLRSDSFLAIIIISDEDDFSGNARREYSQLYNGGVADHSYTASTLDSEQVYLNYLDTLTNTTGATRRYNMSSIAVLDQTCLAARQQLTNAAIIGQRYIDMANTTNGLTGSICDASFANTLNQIQSRISELSTQFYLSKIPQVNTLLVQVNGATIPQDSTNGWTYSATANSVVFHGTAIPQSGAAINVYFVPTTAY